MAGVFWLLARGVGGLSSVSLLLKTWSYSVKRAVQRRSRKPRRSWGTLQARTCVDGD